MGTKARSQNGSSTDASPLETRQKPKADRSRCHDDVYVEATEWDDVNEKEPEGISP